MPTDAVFTIEKVAVYLKPPKRTLYKLTRARPQGGEALAVPARHRRQMAPTIGDSAMTPISSHNACYYAQILTKCSGANCRDGK